MSAIEIASMMSDVGLNISQLCIIFRILQNEVNTKKIEPEKAMKSLSGDMIIQKFDESNYYHETGTKRELILF